MSRLVYKFPIQLRRMQMSSRPAFAFVEGRPDRYVYSQLVRAECQRQGVQYRIVAAEEITGGTGGKPVLTGFFEYLTSKGALYDTFKDKTTVAVFFMDKDVDDYVGTIRRSRHAIYTKMYELENYLFVYGKLADAAAAAAGLDISLLTTRICDESAWRTRAAAAWKEWVKMCLFMRVEGITCVASYGSETSLINKDVFGPVCPNKSKDHLTALKRGSALPSPEFQQSFDRIARLVDKLYRDDEHDRVFKGKWYTAFLVREIESVCRGRRMNRDGLERRLLSNLALTMDFGGAWTRDFRDPVRKLLTGLPCK